MAKVQERAAQIRDLIEKEPGIRQCDIAGKLNVSPASITLAMQELKRSEDVVRTRHSERGFGLKLSKTAQGRAMLRRRWR